MSSEHEAHTIFPTDFVEQMLELAGTEGALRSDVERALKRGNINWLGRLLELPSYTKQDLVQLGEASLCDAKEQMRDLVRRDDLRVKLYRQIGDIASSARSIRR